MCLKKHQCNIKLKHTTHSIIKHNIETGHQLLFDKKKTIIANITLYFPRKNRKAIEIQKHPGNLNRGNGYDICGIWKTILPVTKNWLT